MLPFRSEKDLQPSESELSTVQSQRNDLQPEEFPEGPYGASLPLRAIGKSSPWLHNQHAPNAFGYENRELHEGMPRDYPGDYVPSDEVPSAPAESD